MGFIRKWFYLFLNFKKESKTVYNNFMGSISVVYVKSLRIYIYMLYSHLPYHNDSIIVKTDAHRKTHEERKQEGRRRKTSLQKYSPLTLFVRVRKGCWRVCMWEGAETEHKLHILTPLLWPSRCVFIILLMLGSTPSGLSEGPLGRVWPFLPHLVSNPLGVCWQLLWDPNSTELNNNSTPTTIAYWIFEIECLIVIKRK